VYGDNSLKILVSFIVGNNFTSCMSDENISTAKVTK
jgi:hypothetical protein